MITGIVSSIIASFIFAFAAWVGRGYYDKHRYSLFRFAKIFKVFHSGAQGYYDSFPDKENEKVWQFVHKKFYYLGVSANSIIDRLIKFMESNKGEKIEYHFLLMDPVHDDTIRRQEAHRKGYVENDLMDISRKESLSKEVEIKKRQILTNVERLKNTDNYKAGNVEIRYFQEFLPWWVYMFDNTNIFVGLLPFKNTGEEPVMIIKKNEPYFTLYDVFLSIWERIWRDNINNRA